MNKYLKYALIAILIIAIVFYIYLTYDYLYGDLGSRLVFWNEAEYYLIYNPLQWLGLGL